jgi:hypothetical protein
LPVNNRYLIGIKAKDSFVILHGIENYHVKILFDKLTRSMVQAHHFVSRQSHLPGGAVIFSSQVHTQMSTFDISERILLKCRSVTGLNLLAAFLPH